IFNDLVVVGNQNGLVEALTLKDGKRKWRFQTRGPIFSSPSFAAGKIVFGSADGIVYCLNDKGKIQWKLKTDASVLGSPVIQNETVYIGGSDSCFQAVELASGKPIWRYCGLTGPVTSKPVIYNENIIFGAWDRNLYALNKSNGKLLWKWSNGSSVINYSPAACIPVVYDDVVYIVAPDRYLSAIDIKTGQTLWRTNQSTVRESIGISEDGKMIYGKTMQDTIAAFYTDKEKANAAWKFHAGFGYEHTPSALIEKNRNLFFGTKNGVVYALSLLPNPKINWAHKIDNSMVNTVNVIDDRSIVASTMDGKVILIKVADPFALTNVQKQKIHYLNKPYFLNLDTNHIIRPTTAAAISNPSQRPISRISPTSSQEESVTTIASKKITR
ncbi:MAG: PQQ-binding-like beta-propeller repeat protein, partial [Chitinophagaceae bacterium]